MKKPFLTLGALLIFGFASAQINNSNTNQSGAGSMNQPVQDESLTRVSPSRQAPSPTNTAGPSGIMPSQPNLAGGGQGTANSVSNNNSKSERSAAQAGNNGSTNNSSKSGNSNNNTGPTTETDSPKNAGNNGNRSASGN